MSGPILSAINAVNTELTSLRGRVDIILAAMGEGEISAVEIQAQIEAATQNAIDAVLAQLEGLDVSALEHRMDLHKLILDLKNVYGQEKFLFELFDTAFTVAEFFEQAVIANIVAGDDSIDIANTTNLVVGQEYQVEGGGVREIVTVKEILSTNRFKTNELLANNYDTTAKVLRTTFDIGTTGQASATDGQVYYSGDIDLGAVDKDKAVVIRRTDNDSDVRVWFKDTDHSAWTEMPWGWIRTGLSGGYADHEYPCKARGAFRLKIAVEHGDSAQDVTFKHIVGVHEATGLGGTPRPPEKPVNAIPADGAAGLMETPTLGTVGYEHILGVALASTQIQISEAEDFASTVFDGAGLASTMFSTPAGLLAVSTTYHWRMRFKDANGAWSEWSEATSFATADAFQYVMTPSLTAPSAGATEIGETPTLEASVFSASNPTLVDLNTDGGSDWTDSGTTTGEYHYGGADCPGKPSQVLIDGEAAPEGTLGSLADGQWAWGDQDTLGADTLYVKITGGDPDGQATGYIQRGEIHSASQWQIRSAAGTYSSPVYDSGETADLRSHDVPQGNLEDGTTTYYFRVRYRGAALGLSEWSQERSFTTKDNFAAIIGIALEGGGNGGAGFWARVDENGDDIAVDASFFNAHPTYAGIETVTIDGQAMVKIPKFYYKVDVAPVGSDHAGEKCWWISDTPIGDFKVHPAFMDAGVEVEQFWVGRYQGNTSTDGNLKAQSIEGVTPGSIPYSDATTRSENRNTGGVEGFHLWDVYEFAAIQFLMLIELGTPDVQAAIGEAGYVAGVRNTGTTAAVWRDIHELWGNYYTWFDGMQHSRLDLPEDYLIVRIFDDAGNRTYVPTEGFALAYTGTTKVFGSVAEDSGDLFDLKAVFFAGTAVDAASGIIPDVFLIGATTVDAPFENTQTVNYGSYASNNSLAGLFANYSRGVTASGLFRIAKK